MPIELTNQQINNFWKKVEKTERCWNWTAAKNEKGYGFFGIIGKTDRSHRISWVLNNGQIPDNLFVCHKCDNPKCVNPAHLFLGTNKDNVDDMVAKQRNSKPPSMGGWNKKLFPEDKKHLLGVIADTELGRLTGLNKYVIQRVRKEFGIPALESQTRFKKSERR